MSFPLSNSLSHNIPSDFPITDILAISPTEPFLEVILSGNEPTVNLHQREAEEILTMFHTTLLIKPPTRERLWEKKDTLTVEFREFTEGKSYTKESGEKGSHATNTRWKTPLDGEVFKTFMKRIDARKIVIRCLRTKQSLFEMKTSIHQHHGQHKSWIHYQWAERIVEIIEAQGNMIWVINHYNNVLSTPTPPDSDTECDSDA